MNDNSIMGPIRPKRLKEMGLASQQISPKGLKWSEKDRNTSGKTVRIDLEGVSEQQPMSTNIDIVNNQVEEIENANLIPQPVLNKKPQTRQQAVSSKQEKLKEIKEKPRRRNMVYSSLGRMDNMSKRKSLDKDASCPSNRADPTYIEPFVLPKFEKQQHHLKHGDSQQSNSLQIFPMNSSQVSFNDILSQIRSKTTMSQAHNPQIGGQAMACARNHLVSLGNQAVSGRSSNKMIDTQTNNFLIKRKEEMIQNELKDEKEMQLIQKKLNELKKLQNSSARENIKIIREQKEWHDLQGLTTQRAALTSLNYVFDRSFDINLSQQGYLKQNLRSQFENDYEQYECFEHQFGKNRFKIGQMGQVICKKKKKNQGHQKYFENLEKKNEKLKDQKFNKLAKYLTNGLSTQNYENQLKEEAIVNTKKTTGKTKPGELPQIALNSFQKFDVQFNTDDLSIVQNKPNLEQHGGTKQNEKSKQRYRQQSRQQSGYQSSSHRSSAFEIKNKDLNEPDNTYHQNSHRIQQEQHSRKQDIVHLPFKQKLINTERETSIQQVNSGRMYGEHDEPNLTSKQFDQAEDQSQSNQTSFSPFSSQKRIDDRRTDINRSQNFKLQQNLSQIQIEDQNKDQQDRLKNVHVMGFNALQSQSMNLTQFSNTKSVESSRSPSNNKEKRYPKMMIKESTNAIFTGGLSLEKSHPNTQKSFYKRSKEQHRPKISKKVQQRASRHKFSKSQIDMMPQIHEEIQLLREMSKKNFSKNRPSFQKESYIDQKLSTFTDMLATHHLTHSDFLQTLQKFKLQPLPQGAAQGMMGSPMPPSTSPPSSQLQFLPGTATRRPVINSAAISTPAPLVRSQGTALSIAESNSEGESGSFQDQSEQKQASQEHQNLKIQDQAQRLQIHHPDAVNTSILNRVQNRSKSDGSVEESARRNGLQMKGTMGQLPGKRKPIVKKKGVKELDGFCRYMIKENLIDSIKERRERELDPKFLENKFRVHRWRDFKERRLDVMKEYIDTKRRLRMTRLLVLYVKMTQILRKTANRIQEIKEERKIRHWKMFVGLRLLIGFRKKWRLNFGSGGIRNVQKNKIRHTLILYHLFYTSSNTAIIELSKRGRTTSMKQIIRFNVQMKRQQQMKAQSFLSAFPSLVKASRSSSLAVTKSNDKDKTEGSKEEERKHGMMDPYTIFFNFLEDRAVEWNSRILIDKMKRAYNKVVFVQRRFKSILEVRQTRIELLMSMWDRILLRIYSSVSPRMTTQAQKITDVVGRIISIDPNVKREVVTAYLQRCNANYTIAFAQWRQYFRENVCRHNFNTSNLQLEIESRDIFQEIERSNHSKFIRRKMVESINKQSPITTRLLWTDLLADWVPVKPKNPNSLTRKGDLEPVEQEPFGILQTGPHNITKFSQIQWPEVATKFEQEQDKIYMREFQRYQIALQQQKDGLIPQSPVKRRQAAMGRNKDIMQHLENNENEKEDVYKIKDIPTRAFDLQDYLTEEEIEALVYPSYKYQPDYPPNMIFMPSQVVLFRLARAAFIGTLIIKPRKTSKKNTKVEQHKMQLDDVINISFQPKPKKRKNGPRMFYDDSFIYDVLTYMRPDPPDKPEAEKKEDDKLRKKIKALLDKKNQDPKHKLALAVSAEDLNNLNESFAAESFFDIMSPDPRGLSDEDDDEANLGTEKSFNNPFSLQVNEMEDIQEGDHIESMMESMVGDQKEQVASQQYDEGTSSSSSDA